MKKERQFYIDWLRIILILSVFLFHIGMIFNSWGWHIKNDITYGDRSVLWYIMVFMARWRMPLLILISGAGTLFAIGKRTRGQYVKERFKRLFIPLLFGIFILVPVQVYLERAEQYSSLLAFYPNMFEGVYPKGNFSWHHLWFIAYLFFISLVFAVLLPLFRSVKFDLFVGWIDKMTKKWYGANFFLVPLIASQLILRPFFPENTHDFAHDWAAMAYYILFFLSGYIILSKSSITQNIEKHKYTYLLQTIIATLAMFFIPAMIDSKVVSGITWWFLECTVAWTCSLFVLGFAKKYLNTDSPLRKIANEAIYPFYLLHQPIIVIMAYFVVEWDISVFQKFIMITSSSFVLTVTVYWFIIKPHNILRLIFGMKQIRSKEKHTTSNKKIPILQKVKVF